MGQYLVTRVSGAPVSDEELLDDLRRVATNSSDTTLTQRKYNQIGNYAHSTQSSRFGSWNDALRAAGLSTYDRTTSDETLLADVRRVADEISQPTVSIEQYRLRGTHDRYTLTNRFGSWNTVLQGAGLGTSARAGISDETLFENILRLWEYYGRQPRRSELTMPPSRISQSPYWRRFGSWTKALQSFVQFANAEEVITADELIVGRVMSGESSFGIQTDQAPVSVLPPQIGGSISLSPRRRTPRQPSLRLRIKVLTRDNFTCRACGRSPATLLGLSLELDHDPTPWSKGGETVLENLQTLCKDCNRGKGNWIPDHERE